jgi:hypothetical protein
MLRKLVDLNIRRLNLHRPSTLSEYLSTRIFVDPNIRRPTTDVENSSSFSLFSKVTVMAKY